MRAYKCLGAKQSDSFQIVVNVNHIQVRVEELLRLCETLEAQLHQTRTLGAHLLASTLLHLLAA